MVASCQSLQTPQERSVIRSGSFSCSAQRSAQVTSNTESFTVTRNMPRNPQRVTRTPHRVTWRAGTQSMGARQHYRPRQHTFVKTCLPVPAPMCSSPVHVSALSRPAPNSFSHFLLHSWSTSKTLSHSFCSHMAHHGLTIVMTANICFHWSFPPPVFLNSKFEERIKPCFLLFAFLIYAVP